MQVERDDLKKTECLHEVGKRSSSSGRRVSNTWVTYLKAGDNSWKRLLIPNKIFVLKEAFKASLLDGPAAY